MKILVLTSTFPANRDDLMQHPFQMDFIDLLRKDKHNVTVLTHAKKGFHEKVKDDLDIIWFPWRILEGRLSDINFFKAGNILSLLSLMYNGVKHARKIIVEKKIDLIICLWVIPSGLYVYVNSLLKTIRIPYILWALGSDINKYNQNVLITYLVKKIIQRSAYIFSDGLELCDKIHAMSGKHCEFLPTFRKINTVSVPQRVNSGTCVSFLYVGRHSRVKGIDVLIRAIITLKKENPLLKYCVTIIGEGDLTSHMMGMLAENSLDNVTTFAGKLPDADLFSLYAQSDCVIIPSRSESIPVVLSESLQFNKPMIVTDVGDMGMLGRKYGVARVVEKGDADALADEMRDFIERPFQIDPQKRDELLSLLMMENSMQKILHVISRVGPK